MPGECAHQRNHGRKVAKFKKAQDVPPKDPKHKATELILHNIKKNLTKRITRRKGNR
jgi:hypothetical protein